MGIKLRVFHLFIRRMIDRKELIQNIIIKKKKYMCKELDQENDYYEN